MFACILPSSPVFDYVVWEYILLGHSLSFVFFVGSFCFAELKVLILITPNKNVKSVDCNLELCLSTLFCFLATRYSDIRLPTLCSLGGEGGGGVVSRRCAASARHTRSCIKPLTEFLFMMSACLSVQFVEAKSFSLPVPLQAKRKHQMAIPAR